MRNHTAAHPDGPGGSRTRVQTGVPCTSTIIVGRSLVFPHPIGDRHPTGSVVRLTSRLTPDRIKRGCLLRMIPCDCRRSQTHGSQARLGSLSN